MSKVDYFISIYKWYLKQAKYQTGEIDLLEI